VLKTIEGKWVLFDAKTGEQVEHWPVDAKLLLKNASHTLEAPEGVAPVVPKVPPQHVGVPQVPVATLYEAKDGEELPPGVKKGRKE